MKTIWKIELTAHQKQTITLPEKAIILHVDKQREQICIWCEVNPENKLHPRMIEVFRTGDEIHEDIGTEREYIGSAKLRGGMLIFHVYERLN